MPDLPPHRLRVTAYARDIDAPWGAHDKSTVNHSLHVTIDVCKGDHPAYVQVLGFEDALESAKEIESKIVECLESGGFTILTDKQQQKEWDEAK